MAWRWYRSLYWRIAIGVVAFLAAMLVVQAMLFVWAVSQTGRTLAGQSPGRLGMTVALDLAQVLERDASGYRFVRPSPIVVNGQLVGVVVVPPQAPFGYLLARYAPILALVATGVLIVGTVLTSFLIFGPARRRLRALEGAARRLGAGDLTARAPDRGGDEIAAVASAFNAMAQDLAVRAEALASSDRTRRQLLADVSHELTTPVTAMRGYLETLTMPELELDETTRARYLGIIG